jgi:WD40 repeat protein/tRNA A-37 threonylcarbamoyl transferase component Bud32
MSEPQPADGKPPTPVPGPTEEHTLIQEPGDRRTHDGRVADAMLVHTGGMDAPAIVDVARMPLSRLGEYELLSEIGRGGMGVVFKARHVRLHRVVALKMILGGLLARPEDLQRFETEAAAAAQLQHPNIVALYEVGAESGQPYFSMEHVSGSSLAQRVALGVLPGRLAASYLERLAQAVHYAHSRGVIHRDLKPANVLLDDDDQPKITDFGLAKVLQGDSGQTRTGAVIGTPSYMAPEQAGGQTKAVSPAVDVYALGAILYELLTGSPPFRGETALATLTLVADKDPVPPRLLNPRVDRDLETICLKCLEKDPQRRYGSAEALADDLRRYLGGEPIAARRLGTLGRALKWCRRKPAAAALLAVSLLALVGFTAFQWRATQEERRLREQAEKSDHESKLHLDILRYYSYLAHMRQVQHHLAAADLGGAERLLQDMAKGRPDLRDWEWYYLKGVCAGRATLAGHAGRATAVAYGADGKRLASAGGQPLHPGEVKVWEVGTGRCLLTISKAHSNAVGGVAFSPDGKLLATAGGDGSVRLWDAAGGKERARLRGHRAHVTGVAFAPDGKRLASSGGDRLVLVWDVARALAGGDALLFSLRGHGGEVTGVAISPDGKLVASASLDETVRLWDAGTGQPRHTLRGHQGEVMALAFRPDGQVLASGGGPGQHRGQVRLWDVATGKPLGVHYGLSGRVLGVSVSWTGQVAAAGNDGLVYVWDSHSSSEPVVFRADGHQVYGVAFSPGGGRLATAGGDGRVRLWYADGGQEMVRLPGQARIEGVAFSPDGKAVASCGREPGHDGEARVWDLESGKLLALLHGHAGQVHAVAFSRDGKQVATGGEDQTVRLYDLGNPAGLTHLTVECLAAQALATVGGPGASVIQILTAAKVAKLDAFALGNPASPRVLAGHPGRVLAVALHPSEDLLASAGDGDVIRLWNTRTGQVVRTLEGHTNYVLALAFSPDGRLLASGSYDRTVRVWDVKTGDSTVLAGHAGSTSAISFSPDGAQLASGGSDRTVRVWDLAARKEFLRLEGLGRPVVSLAYHPRGRRLASVGEDRAVRLWDLVTRQEILELACTDGVLRSVSFSRDGRYLAAGGQNTGVRVWEGVGR